MKRIPVIQSTAQVTISTPYNNKLPHGAADGNKAHFDKIDALTEALAERGIQIKHSDSGAVPKMAALPAETRRALGVPVDGDDD